MTRHRYTINERMQLVADDGAVLGRVSEVSFVLHDGDPEEGEVPAPELTFDDVDGALPPVPPFRGATSTATSRAKATSKSKSKSKPLGLSDSEHDLDVQAAWAYWVEKRNPRFAKLEPSQAKLIRKGIDAVGQDDLRIAIDALLASEWHREHNRLSLSTILATRPGGPTLRDQLTEWIERAPSSQEASSEQERLNGRLRRWRVELGKLEEQDELRPGDIERRDELRGLIAELGELV
jgi:hypothetical protein